VKGTSIGDFFVSLGFNVEDEELVNFEKHLQTAMLAAAAFGAAAIAAASGLAIFTAHTAEAIDTLGDWAEEENVSIEAVQELGHAAQLSGSSLEAVKSTVDGLNRVTGEAVLGLGRGAKVFEKLGLDAKGADGKVKSFDTILAEVADKMQGLSRQEQIGMAEKLGIDRSLIPLLEKGKDGIQALRDEARKFGIVSEQDAKEAGAFQDSMDRTVFLIKALREQVAIKLMPSLRDLIDRFRSWVLANRDWINLRIDQVLAVISGTVSFLVDWFFRLVHAVEFVVNAFFELNPVLQLAGAAMLLFWARALLVPVALGAIAAGILLIVDDLVNWAEGNDSVIGQILAKYPDVALQVYAVAAAVTAVKDAFVDLGIWIGESIAKVVLFIDKAGDLFSLGFGGGASMRIPQFSAAISGVNNSLNANGGVVGKAGSNTQNLNNNTTNQTNHFNIRSTDPIKAGQEVNRALSNTNRNATRNHKSQVTQ